jgi:hypothetical protein
MHDMMTCRWPAYAPILAPTIADIFIRATLAASGGSMFRRGLCTGIAIALGLAAHPSRACQYDPFLFQLRGETEDQARARSAEIFADFRVKERLDREQHDFHSAERIYLALVVPNRLADTAGFPSTRVRPLSSFKGALPTEELNLVDQTLAGICTDMGDGLGVKSAAGNLVVVFEGMPKTAYRPRGVDSFQVSSIRTVALLDWLRKLGKDLTK